ncbi:MAG: hypothetical protein KGJ07_02575 [Patescibacteria group bacterium]|nr:hypothetical protein [Patescibacteria group bacterium]
MKQVVAFILPLFFLLLVAVPSFADNNCRNIQRHNGGSVNNNCNNNSNSQDQSQTQNNNQNVNITMPAVQLAPTVNVLPHTGPADSVLFTLFASFPIGILLRKKA